MGVSAVPGSGKTWTLTRLAARLVMETDLDPDQEVLVVTLVNSSVENFSSRIATLIEEEGLVPDVGYRVCTLHTLAHEIVRARPDLAGLSEDFHVIDQRQKSKILRDVVDSQSHSAVQREYLEEDLSDYWRKEVLANRFPRALKEISKNAIKHAKSHGISVEELRGYTEEEQGSSLLAELVQSVYQGYQRTLNVRNAVDFGDLMRHALRVLRTDEELLRRLRNQWPYVLEDEAQDSSKIQEQILRLIVEENGNWVRVGDPNQAIYESFTTANPNLLRRFTENADQSPNLAQSGRSQPSVMKLANGTIWWSQKKNPKEALRGALTKPYIEETSDGDPQPNPPNQPDRIAFVDRGFTEEEEIKMVIRSLRKWLQKNPGKTAAILAPMRTIGQEVISRLEAMGLPYTDSLLKTTSQTRETARRIEHVMNYLAEPTSAVQLAQCYEQWRASQAERPGAKDIEEMKDLISGCERVEDYIWPQGELSWLADIESNLGNDELLRLEDFRERVRYWLEISELPVGQLVMAIARDLYSDPDRLALAQEFAGLLRRANSHNSEWGLSELTNELHLIAENERGFEGRTGGGTEFDPDAHEGKVAVSTMHGAKGLEWDRVHMLAVNEYHFPSADPGDSMRAERFYVRDDLNLQAETLAQIDALANGSEYAEGQATLDARQKYARERIRLFYVCVTRAREELMVTTNVGREDRSHDDNEPARIFKDMKAFCDAHVHSS